MLVLLSSTAWLLIRWRETEADSLAAIGGLLLIAAAIFFLRYELRQPDPVFEPRFFLHRSFAAATGAVALSNLAMYCTLLAIPVLMAGKNWTSIQTGSVLMALTATSMVVAPLGGRLADLWGRRWPSVAGLSVLTASLLPFWLSAGELPVLTLVVCLGGAGIGL